MNQTLNDNLTILDYYFFSYDVINHRTLLVKFDITRTIYFQQAQILYNAYLYVSKLPSLNYKIHIGIFSGLYEKELDGTITDHFTFCLILISNRRQNEFNMTVKTTIDHEFFKSSYHEQHIIHYCTKMGPDEDRHRHHIKQGSKGNHILLLLQLLIIVIFLAILQIVRIIRDQKSKQWHFRRISRFYHELLSRKEHTDMPIEALAMPRFTRINNDESQEEIDKPEKAKQKSLTFSHQRLPLRSQSRSPSASIGPANTNSDASLVEHILETKPWLQISH